MKNTMTEDVKIIYDGKGEEIYRVFNNVAVMEKTWKTNTSK